MRSRRPERLLPICLLTWTAVILTACGDMTEPAPSEPAVDGLVVDQSRASLMPAAGQGVVYLRIRNGTDQDDRLLRVETGAAKIAEIHETFEDGGVVRMRAFPEGLDVPAGGTVTLEPGGLHLMLISPDPVAADGESIRLKLVFEQAGPVTVEAPLIDLGA